VLYREIIAVCSQIHIKHINTLCGQKVEFVNVKLVVHIVTTGLYRINKKSDQIQQLPMNNWQSTLEKGNAQFG
jgi:hypothetical protein